MSRGDIHYWKCDRPAAFHGTTPRGETVDVPEREIRAALREHFRPGELALRPSSSQGNHLTWVVEIDGRKGFLRIENGPEGDDYLEMESVILGRVASLGVPVPEVLGCDASRSRVPFAWQLLEFYSEPDLNQWAKRGTLDENAVAYEIGRNVARWQRLRPRGFGPFRLSSWRSDGEVRGWHENYADYFLLRLDRHLDFLVTGNLIGESRRGEIAEAVKENSHLLDFGEGCLVHKDLALWNVIGTSARVVAFIDFDDAISGDPMDDLSLLACFHHRAFLERALEGYQSERALPGDALPRFWLHLLRNLVVKSVIRLGAGYFRRDSEFFLIGSGSSGEELRDFTKARLSTALRGLRTHSDLSIL